jgi:Putative Ig domain
MAYVGGIMRPGWCKRFARMACASVLLVPTSALRSWAQQHTPSQLSVSSIALPKAFRRQPYHAELGVQGGTAPFHWTLQSGALPPGMELAPNGVISGSTSVIGEFPFVAVVTDSSTPPRQQTQPLLLRVVAPLMARWLRPPKVNGLRIEGAIAVSNQTGDDFDLTVIVLAVDNTGRATAIGYQHFTLQKNTEDFEIPFGEQLPPGAYDINADVVAEIAEISAIHRVRLVSAQTLSIVSGP